MEADADIRVTTTAPLVLLTGELKLYLYSLLILKSELKSSCVKINWENCLYTHFIFHTGAKKKKNNISLIAIGFPGFI